ncbi:MAG: type II secretion system protein [Candidatus Moraniibacteriota bacterium]
MARFFFQKGFTLLEMLLSVALMGALAGLSLPVYQSFQVRNDLDIAATTLAQSIRRAEVLSQGSAGDTTWGVAIQSGSIVIFQGASYAVRDVTWDEVFSVPTSITVTGASEIIFAKVTGLPTTTPTITLSTPINETRTLTINTYGTVLY